MRLAYVTHIYTRRKALGTYDKIESNGNQTYTYISSLVTGCNAQPEGLASLASILARTAVVHEGGLKETSAALSLPDRER